MFIDSLSKSCLDYRFGLMHTLATNILMWMSVVLDESMKQLEEIYDIQKKKLNLIESKLEKGHDREPGETSGISLVRTQSFVM